MSDTPRTNECTFDVIVKRGDAHLGVEHYKDGSGDFVESDFCKKLERELNAANEHIKRLEALIDRLGLERWCVAKEAKP
jgi:hypothetical protein